MLVNLARAADASEQIAPASISGTVMSRSHTYSLKDFMSESFFLKADNTYEPLLKHVVSPPGPNSYREPSAAGTYTYQVTGPKTAVLTFSWGGNTRTETLTFSRSDAGTMMSPAFTSFSNSFDLRVLNSGDSLFAASLRCRAGAGATAIAGVAISRSRTVMIRAVGPSLKRFGITTGLASPTLEVYDSRGVKIRSGANWRQNELPQESLRRLTAMAGMFPLAEDANDAVAYTSLSAGAYTIQCSGSSPTDAGEVLIECYLLP
jgi:hypothetical protein